MAEVKPDAKSGAGFFRKVARFVAHPGAEWLALAGRQGDRSQHERSERQAMLERKRRNDFVRKREFDTLRRLRRDGLSPEQLAALGGSSKAADSELRTTEPSAGTRAEAGVKAKIDAIEQQMAGERGPRESMPRQARPSTPPAGRTATERPGLSAPSGTNWPPSSTGRPVPQPASVSLPLMPDIDLSAPVRGAERPLIPEFGALADAPELDAAVIAFANADFKLSERLLAGLCQANGAHHRDADTWHVLLDLYRATGQELRFDALALDYSQRFARSSPPWYSLPKRVADAAARLRPDTRSDTRGVTGEAGWVSPAQLDDEAVAGLHAVTLQLPLPWVLDWSALRHVDAQGAARLQRLLAQWAPQAIDMRWLDAECLFTALQQAAPTGARDADPTFWMARLEALRLANRPVQFDDVAIDYCMTYEVSPPSWERARCQVRIGSAWASATKLTLSIISGVSSSFVESHLQEDSRAGQSQCTVELSGQLTGDLSVQLQQIDRQLGSSRWVEVSCASLIRVDFIAAGDLLNWVLAKQTEQRSVSFVNAHRLLALFFAAMGIDEHASVQIPRD